MSVSTRLATPFYYMTHMKELPRRGVCRYEILSVEQVSEGDFDVTNLVNGHKYQVALSRKTHDWGCTCQYGTQEIATGIDPNRRCKHVRAVRAFVVASEER